jgi:hypothetical protein
MIGSPSYKVIAFSKQNLLNKLSKEVFGFNSKQNNLKWRIL